MVNKRTCELLTILIRSPGQYFKYDELAHKLSVSTRSVRNYKKEVTAFLAEHGFAHLVQATSRGLSFTGSSSEGSLITSRLIDKDFYLYKLSPDERIRIIALKMLLSYKSCTLSSLEKEFNASRVTLIKDMDQVRLLLDHHRIAFDTSTSQGYRLIVKEKDRRELVTRLAFHSADSIWLNSGKVNIYDFFVSETCFRNDRLKALPEILKEAEDFFGITVSDARFEELLFTLKLTLARIQEGYSLPRDDAEEEEVRKLGTDKIVSYLAERMYELIAINLPASEKAWLARKLYEYHFYPIKPIEDNFSMQTHMILIHFLDRIGREISVDLSEDCQLITQLTNHLKDMKKIYQSGISPQNEFRDQIISEYSAYYNLVKDNCAAIENHFGYRFSDDEIAYILLYLAVSIERSLEEDTAPLVIIVCHGGIGTANFLVEQLKANFHLRILASTSVHKLSDISKELTYDLIISTIALHDNKDRWIKVSPMLEDEDIIGLQRVLLDIKKEKRKNRLAQLKNERKKTATAPEILPWKLEKIFPKQNIILDADCKDWREGIRLAASPLLQSGSITEQYVQAIESSAVANGAYFVFCPGVALAHAGPGDGVNWFEVSLVRLKAPVCFGHMTNDPVRYILCFGSTANCEDANLILKLMNVISHEGILDDMDHCMLDSQLRNRLLYREHQQ